MYCLLEVVSVCPQKLAPKFIDKIDWIKVRVFTLQFVNHKTNRYNATLTHQPMLIVANAK